MGADGAARRPASRRSSSTPSSGAGRSVFNTGRQRAARQRMPWRAQVPVGAGAPERLLWTAGSPVQGSDRPLDLALARSPRAASPTAAVLSADGAGQVPPRAPGRVACVRRLAWQRQSRPGQPQPVTGAIASHALPARNAGAACVTEHGAAAPADARMHAADSACAESARQPKPAMRRSGHARLNGWRRCSSARRAQARPSCWHG